MNKKIWAVMIAIVMVGTMPSQVSLANSVPQQNKVLKGAEQVTHLSKEEVLNKITALANKYGGVACLTDEKVAELHSNQPDLVQSPGVFLDEYGYECNVQLFSGSEDTSDTEVRMCLKDKSGNEINDVKYYYMYNTDKLLTPEELNTAEGVLVSISEDGIVKLVKNADRAEGFCVWAEYNQAIYLFRVKIYMATKTNEILARKKADEIIKEQKWANLPSKAAKAEAVYKYLAEYITYDWTYQYKYGDYLYGAFIEKKAVCNGYSKAFQYIMKQLDINCEWQYGYVNDNTGSIGDSHAWVQVQLDDGNWYFVDVTYGDKEGYNKIDYLYCFQGTEKFLESHHKQKVPGAYATGTKYIYSHYEKQSRVVKNKTDLENLLASTETQKPINFVYASSISKEEVDAAVSRKWSDAKPGVTNGVRIGETNDVYLLADYDPEEKVVETPSFSTAPQAPTPTPSATTEAPQAPTPTPSATTEATPTPKPTLTNTPSPTPTKAPEVQPGGGGGAGGGGGSSSSGGGGSAGGSGGGGGGAAAPVVTPEPTEVPTQTEKPEETKKPEETSAPTMTPTPNVPTPKPYTYGPWKTTKKPTCTKEGKKVRTRSDGKTEEKTIPALGHKYKVTFKWSGYSKCTATAVCDTCKKKVTKTATIKSKITKKPTKKKNGVKTYTASVQIGDDTFTATKKKTLKKK